MSTLFATTNHIGAAIAAKLRALADPMGPKIDRLRGNRLENTPKRQCQGMSARCEAGNLERVRRALLALAAAWESEETVPAELAKLRTRAAVEPLVTKIIEHPSYYVVCESDKFRDTGPTALALRALVARVEAGAHAEQDAERARLDTIKAMEERIRFSPIPGFFPTPPGVIEQMIGAADFCAGLKVLEPSAGKGDLAIAAADAGADVVCFEVVPTLADLCTAKGLACECCDFMSMTPTPGFDRVLMNPPFENGQDAAHVRRAFDWLAPGGRIVALVSAGVMFRQNKAAEAFRSWLEEVGHTSEELGSDAFKGAFRSTSVAVVMLTITKTGGAA